MKITFLGTSHGIAEANRFCSSAVVTVGDGNYVIDGGAPLSTLCQRYGFALNSLKGIFITHSHHDHCVGLAELAFQVTGFGRYNGVTIPVYVPDRRFCDPLLCFVSSVTGGPSPSKTGRLDFSVYSAGEIFSDKNIRITAVPTSHIGSSHAFLIEGEGKRICFTGDMTRDMTDYPKAVTKTDFDLVITEGAHQTLSDPSIIDVLSHSRTKSMLVNHINDAKNTPQVIGILSAALKDRFPVAPVADGDVVEL